jgi:maltokinase
VLLAHLAEVGFAEIPAPLGTLTWRSPAGVELTLAQGDAFLPNARDGWEWCVERLEGHVAHGDDACLLDCDPWIGARLGQLVGRLHDALGRPSSVIPEPRAVAAATDVERWRAQAHRTLDDALALTAEQDREAGTSLTALEPAMREAIDTLPVDRPISTQPVHGDLHVGQVLEWADGLAVIDFDGNPALSGGANDLRQPVERDIAQMASSLDHVGRVVDHRTAGRARPIVEAWIARTRREFLGTLDPDPRLLAAFEVEQECRELVYAARFLPRWRYAPMATLRARFGEPML